MARTFKRQRGFLTFAQNGTTDYLRLAYGLALSLRATQAVIPWLSVIVTPGTPVPDHYREVFDEVIDIPWGDAASESDWKLENEWKAFHITPYEETIKLDADMLFTRDIGYWWPMLSRQDVWASTTARTYRGSLVTSDHYRKTFTDNDLPDVYSALLYFRVTESAQALFEIIELIFNHWDVYSRLLKPQSRPKQCSTDVALALGIRILDQDMTHPGFPIMEFVHMKSRLQDWPEDIGENWLPEIDSGLTRGLILKIGRYPQSLPVHYHLKDFLTDDMIAKYEAAWPR
jgi:hypothetical protein